MKRIVIAVVLASALVLPATVSATEDENAREITAIGVENHHGWLRTAGPDAQGRYTVRIDISDLDATTRAGNAAMFSRVKLGTSMLCSRVADTAESREYSTAIQLACWRDALSKARPQMDKVRASAPMTMLQLGTGPAR